MGVLLSPACPEGGEVYHQVHHEGAPDQGDQQEKEQAMPSHCPHRRFALREEEEEEALLEGEVKIDMLADKKGK